MDEILIWLSNIASEVSLVLSALSTVRNPCSRRRIWTVAYTRLLQILTRLGKE